MSGERNAGRGQTGTSPPVFGDGTLGIPTGMQDSEKLPDDVPVADAVEQQRTPLESVPDEEASTEQTSDVPLEAAAADWQEQQEIVELDPDEDMIDE